MANIPIYTGSATFTPGDTPFGFYDTDVDFQTDAPRIADWCAQRLGYPIENIELQDIQFFAAFKKQYQPMETKYSSIRLERTTFLWKELIPVQLLTGR